MILPFRKLLLWAQQQFMGFDPVVWESTSETTLKKKPPIFLIGAPRSGSTAFIQLLYQALELAYMSNVMALVPNRMITMTRIFPRIAKGYTGEIRNSSYGYIPGILSPNEVGKILRFWFDSELPEQHIRGIRRTISSISGATGRPLFFKNQCNTTRLDAILTVIPEARFVFLKRAPLYTAQSILLTRRKLYSDDYKWWSVQPPGYEAILEQDPYFQIIWQVLRLEQIAQTLCKSKPTHCITVDYEMLCSKPKQSIDEIRAKFDLAKSSKNAKIPPLVLANQKKISSLEWEKLKYAYAEVKKSI